MVTDLQYVAIVAFLIWGLASSLAGVLANDPDAARLIWPRHRGGDVDSRS
jgi:hypothetical protein